MLDTTYGSTELVLTLFWSLQGSTNPCRRDLLFQETVLLCHCYSPLAFCRASPISSHERQLKFHINNHPLGAGLKHTLANLARLQHTYQTSICRVSGGFDH